MKVGRWCFVAKGATEFNNAAIAFIMLKDVDKYVGYPLTGLGDFLCDREMDSEEYEFIRELTHAEKQKLISFGHNPKILNYKGDTTYFTNYWAIFYSPRSSKRRLALRNSFKMKEIWAEQYVIPEYLCTLVNNEYKSINAIYEFEDKFSHEGFSENLTTKKFLKFIECIEDEESLFERLLST